MDCHWCESITDNEMELILNERGIEIWVVFCDRCKKAREEMGDKGEGASHAERLNETDQFVASGKPICESLNTANI